MANSSFNLTSLDFDTLKSSLQTYLQSQTIFQDYDFTGSNMNVLLDVLSYNTYLNSFYLNMVAAESFLDSAQLRDSVVSHAKELNYIPSSATSAEAVVNLSFDTTGITTGSFVIPKGTSFSGTNSNGSFTFSTNTNLTSISSSNTFTFSNVSIYEGTYINESFIVDYTQLSQRFILSNASVDTGSIAVTVSENNGSNNIIYTQATSLFGLNSNSTVYFLQAAQNGQYEIVFGDGVFGDYPLNTSVIIITYRITKGSSGSGVSTFFLNQDLGSYNGGTAISTVTTVSNSSNGSDPESIESIRFRAPRSYQVQDRAVTTSDYKTLILDNFNDVEDVNVFGGETLPNPEYGVVYISPSTYSGAPLANQRKADILTYLLTKKVINITNKIIDPNYVYIVPTVVINVNFTNTSLTPVDFQSAVLNSISNFNLTYLQKFDTTFRYSKLLEAIDNTNSSINGNLTSIQIYKLLEPTLNTVTSLTTSFGNELNMGSITSSSFILTDGNTYQITDVNPNAVGITGILYLKQITTNNTQNYINVGTIDYMSGTLSIKNITVYSFIDGIGIKVFATSTYNDIIGNSNNIVEIDLGSTTVMVNAV